MGTAMAVALAPLVLTEKAMVVSLSPHVLTYETFVAVTLVPYVYQREQL